MIRQPRFSPSGYFRVWAYEDSSVILNPTTASKQVVWKGKIVGGGPLRLADKHNTASRVILVNARGKKEVVTFANQFQYE